MLKERPLSVTADPPQRKRMIPSEQTIESGFHTVYIRDAIQFLPRGCRATATKGKVASGDSIRFPESKCPQDFSMSSKYSRGGPPFCFYHFLTCQRQRRSTIPEFVGTEFQKSSLGGSSENRAAAARWHVNRNNRSLRRPVGPNVPPTKTPFGEAFYLEFSV